MFIFEHIYDHENFRLEAHTCNPSYSGGRDQEDHGSKPALENNLPDPVSKKRAGGAAEGVGPEFKSWYLEEEEKQEEE
jgi:hypothetical protein